VVNGGIPVTRQLLQFSEGFICDFVYMREKKEEAHG